MKVLNLEVECCRAVSLVAKQGKLMTLAFENGLLDRSVWERMVNLDRTSESPFLRQLVARLSEEGLRYLTEIDVSLANGNWDRVSHQVHALRSATSYVGASRLGMICEDLRKAAVDADLARATPLALRLHKEFIDVIGAAEAAAADLKLP